MRVEESERECVRLCVREGERARDRECRARGQEDRRSALPTRLLGFRAQAQVRRLRAQVQAQVQAQVRKLRRGLPLEGQAGGHLGGCFFKVAGKI